jgi:hypothetical protein
MDWHTDVYATKVSNRTPEPIPKSCRKSTWKTLARLRRRKVLRLRQNTIFGNPLDKENGKG